MAANPLKLRIDSISHEVNNSRKTQISSLKSQIEYYHNPPQAHFSLPPIPHHWLIVQDSVGPERMLIGQGGREFNMSNQLGANSLVYIPPFTPTEWLFTPAEGCIHIMIPDSLILECSTEFRKLEQLYSIGTKVGVNAPHTCSQIQSAIPALRHHPESISQLDASQYLLQTTKTFLKEIVHSSAASKDQHKGLPQSTLNKLKEYMWSNLGENISLEELSAVCGMSVGHFSRSFKSTLKTTPHKYLTCMRVSKARTLIAAGNSLIETALLCGFADQAHFSRIFKLWTKHTPSEFRLATC